MMPAMTEQPVSSSDPSRRRVAFISHHSSQVAVARRIKARLAEQGVDGWLAPDDIAAGTAFDQAIVDQIARSDAIVLLFCAQSDQSRHVKRELMLGEDANTAILPVRLENVAAQGLAYWLKDYQWIDWFAGEDAAIDALVAAMTGAPAAPRPAPVAAARPKAASRRPLWLALGAVALAALVAGGM
ncbi:MAG: hypothetical protein DI569_16055 [Sphingopyxis macrogoltabida]|uniref:TIR domain-containing protein n=1 Tax=Sphingopyxis macrogoltabida TaxID=33050 RepID=A0A2W5L037_SPHMC|nr:MAG: hypothetical protein DI569_16055 [Sphingopyxis macrogoltabida]